MGVPVVELRRLSGPYTMEATTGKRIKDGESSRISAVARGSAEWNVSTTSKDPVKLTLCVR